MCTLQRLTPKSLMQRLTPKSFNAILEELAATSSREPLGPIVGGNLRVPHTPSSFGQWSFAAVKKDDGRENDLLDAGFSEKLRLARSIAANSDQQRNGLFSDGNAKENRGTSMSIERILSMVCARIDRLGWKSDIINLESSM